MNNNQVFQQPSLKKITPNVGSSFSLKRFTESIVTSLPHWHFHPEIELVFIDHGNGKRHIGNHISYYSDGDLLLIGSNVPHYGFAGRLTENESEIVVHLNPEFLGPQFFDSTEMQIIQNLLKRSKQGISFGSKTKKQVGEILHDMLVMNGFDKLISLLKILQLLAKASDADTLNVSGVYLEVYSNEHDRINQIYDYVSKNFEEHIKLSDIASLINMTIPAFCRYFKKVTNKTFTNFVNEYRIVHAQKLLADNHMSITEVCHASGFNNVSYFNKQFKFFTNKNPSDYRKELRTLVE